MLRFILKLIPALVCAAGVIVYLALHYSFLSEGPGKDLAFEYVEKEIYINGYHVYNYQLENAVMRGFEIGTEEEVFGRPVKEDDQVTLLDDEPDDGTPANAFVVAAAENWLKPELKTEELFVPLDRHFQDMLGIQMAFSGDFVTVVKSASKPYEKPAERDYSANSYGYFLGSPFIDIDAVMSSQILSKGSLDLSDIDARTQYYINNFLADHFERFADRRQEEVFLDLNSTDFYWCPDAEAENEDYIPIDSNRPGQVLYARLSALEAVPEFGISSYYEPVSGLYISASGDIPAADYFSKNNADYMTGRAEYMKHIQKRLDTDTAYYMEYLFRKYAYINDVSEELLIGLCRTESAYTLELQSAAVGIMQLMPATVRGWGWTVEDVSTLEGNISFGSMYIKYMIDQFGGDEIRALSAYNQGINRVRGGSYETWYAYRVLDYKDNIFSWCRQNGYSEEFRDIVAPGDQKGEPVDTETRTELMDETEGTEFVDGAGAETSGE